MRLVRERMQALSSRYGRVLVIKAGVIFYVPLEHYFMDYQFYCRNYAPRLNNLLTDVGLCL